jgi:hypothetical protein
MTPKIARWPSGVISNSCQEVIEIGETRTVVGRMIGHQIVIERIKVYRADRGSSMPSVSALLPKHARLASAAKQHTGALSEGIVCPRRSAG